MALRRVPVGEVDFARQITSGSYRSDINCSPLISVSAEAGPEEKIQLRNSDLSKAPKREARIDSTGRMITFGG